MLAARLKIQMRLHRLRWIHVYRLHEPARLIGADRQQCEIDRPETVPNVREEWRVSGVTGEVDPLRACRDDESAPQRAIAIQRPPRRKVMRGRQRDRQRRRGGRLPPIEFFDAAQSNRPQQPCVT